jgi:hypothetical protein
MDTAGTFVYGALILFGRVPVIHCVFTFHPMEQQAALLIGFGMRRMK